jgi:Polyketide cyclase / dehydrase and lipid transport
MWYMKPVEVTAEVPQPIGEVYDFLDVVANHEPFTNHMLRDWEYSGPDRGIGSKARVKVTAGGRTDTVEIEVVAAERPTRIVERNVSAGRRRIATGTYTLSPLPDGWTRIAFVYAWQHAPFADRVAGPIMRAVLRRCNARAMERLASQLAAREREARAA